MNKYNFVITVPPFNDKSGGAICLYTLSRTLKELGHNVKVYDIINSPLPYRCIKNPIFDDYINGCNIDIDFFERKDTILIYPETITGNPLKAKRVVRWLLCDIGAHCDEDIYKSWDSHDRIYFFSSFTKYGSDIRQLLVLNINPIFRNLNLNRESSCFTIRKANTFHKRIQYIHEEGSTHIEDINEEQMFELFNHKKYFYCYDPYSFIVFVAALCGCIVIVYPLEGYSKEDWLNSLFIGPYFKNRGINEAYGIAYGIEELEYAEKTLHLVKDQIDDIILYGKETVKRFIDDLAVEDVNTVFKCKK